MSDSNYTVASDADKTHFIQCGVCQEWMDCRDLDEVCFHETHVAAPDVQYTGSKKVEDNE